MVDVEKQIGEYIMVMYKLMDKLFEIEIFKKNVFVIFIRFFNENNYCMYLLQINCLKC